MSAGNDVYADSTLQHAVQHALEIDGISFLWWSVGEHPSFVTVSNESCGHAVDLTTGSPDDCARRIATKLLREYRDRHGPR